MQAARDYKPPVFPFTGLVGQRALKLSLALNVIHPGIMGVLARGEKGTAKSTAARALAALLPEIEVVKDCHFGDDPRASGNRLCPDCRMKRKAGETLETEWRQAPFYTLPVNATEDTLVGAIDFEYALRTGKKRFSPGLLAAVHRGILYVDEVNLLDDHLVDLLLDVSAWGVNVVEREGISFSHPSRFILVGTMNPEEGELRPQLLDRFGLCVNIEGLDNPDERVEIIRRREAYESNPAEFMERWRAKEETERERIMRGKELFPRTKLGDEQLNEIATTCRAAGVAGHRADIVIEKAARAIASYRGHEEVTSEDISLAAFLALPHRIRPEHQELPQDDEKRDPRRDEGDGEEESSDQEMSQDDQQEGGEEESQRDQQGSAGQQEMGDHMERGQPSPEMSQGSEEPQESSTQPSADYQNEIFEIGDLVPIRTVDMRHQRDRMSRKSFGRRQRSRTQRKSGRYVRSTMTRTNDDLAFDATLRAAAPFQCRRKDGNLAVCIMPEDIREKVRERKTCTLLVFVVDASGSMGTKLMTETKGAIMYLLLEAYQKRDLVCMVAFKGDGSELLLPPTDSIELAKQKLDELPTGGKTPLCSGLLQGFEVVSTSLRKNPDVLPLLVLITDGRANVGANKNRSYEGIFHSRLYEELYTVADAMQGESRLKSMVIDAEEKRMGAFGKAQKLAERMGAKYLVLEEIRSGNIARAVRDELGR